MGPEERAIREVHAAWVHAINGGDLGRLRRLMADDELGAEFHRCSPPVVEALEHHLATHTDKYLEEA